jgi:hypothetical protein
MEKIAVVSVYYGTLPPYYRLWLRSCEYNSTIDFYLVTDIELDKLPENVHKINLSFTEFHALAEKKLGRKVCLDAPYKICDYRPMFGVIMEEYLKGYDYWANCDMDMLFGDLRNFFNQYELKKYDRFLHLGHLSLYRNTSACNQYYKLSGSKCGSWEKVVSTQKNCLFDEWSGVYGIFHENNLPMFEERIFADISMLYSRFRLALDDINYDKQVFYWENGHVYRSYWLDEEEHRDEFIYIHFKKRHFGKEAFDAASVKAFFIGPNGFTEKTAKVKLNDVERINPFYGKAYECRELKLMEWKLKLKSWRERLYCLMGIK